MNQNTSTSDGYASERLDGYFQEQAAWRSAANSKGRGYVVSITPGINDRAVQLASGTVEESRQLSRRISPDALEGSLLAQLIQRSRPLLDTSADNLMVLTSFNEFHEDTQI
jgi:hypothetical protein